MLLLSRVRLFATLWTVARQAPLFMGFPGKNTGVGCHVLLQGIFSIQGLNQRLLHFLHWQADSLQPSHLGIPVEPCVCVCVCVCESLSHVQLFATPQTVALQVPTSMRFSRQEYWSGLPCPSSGDLPDPGIEATSPALQGDPLPSEPPQNSVLLSKSGMKFASIFNI